MVAQQAGISPKGPSCVISTPSIHVQSYNTNGPDNKHTLNHHNMGIRHTSHMLFENSSTSIGSKSPPLYIRGLRRACVLPGISYEKDIASILSDMMQYSKGVQVANLRRNGSRRTRTLLERYNLTRQVTGEKWGLR